MPPKGLSKYNDKPHYLSNIIIHKVKLVESPTKNEYIDSKTNIQKRKCVVTINYCMVQVLIIYLIKKKVLIFLSDTNMSSSTGIEFP